MRLRALLLAVPLAVIGLAVPANADDPLLTVEWETTYGGGATGRGGGTTASLSQEFIQDWGMAGVSRFNGKVGLHHGGWGAAFKRIDGKWLVRWRVWAERGSRYDVKSYTVRLTYTVLQ